MQDIRDIVIVEDDGSVARLLADALSDEGYTVRTFGDGRSALTAIETAPPDLVLLDLDLPLMNGVELLARLRHADFPYLPIVIITASTQSSGLLAQGATKLLAKPFDLDDLLVCVARYTASAIS